MRLAMSIARYATLSYACLTRSFDILLLGFRCPHGHVNSLVSTRRVRRMRTLAVASPRADGRMPYDEFMPEASKKHEGSFCAQYSGTPSLSYRECPRDETSGSISEVATAVQQTGQSLVS